MQLTMQSAFDQRENNFDFIRLALSILVIFSHSYPLATGSEINEPFNVLTRQQVTGGHIAVDLFFIISGFLITASYERSAGVFSFISKRVKRIYPAFIVAMLFGVLIALPAGDGNMVASSPIGRALDFILQSARLQEAHYTGAFAANPGAGAVNGSVWSIQYEFWCYLGVLFLGTTGILRSNRVLVVLFCTSIAISILFVIFKWTPGGGFLGVIFGYPPFWARLLPMYLAGVAFYRLRRHLSLKASWISIASASLLIAALIPHGWSLVFPIAGAFLVLALAFHPAIRLGGWSRFGDFSYGTYLYAFPVAQLIMHYFGHPISPWILFSLAAPATLMCAFVSWHAVEKWFLYKISDARAVMKADRAQGDAAGIAKLHAIQLNTARAGRRWNATRNRAARTGVTASD
jgi:peptidoglycan/LPS O-acetylase OafA/YrhL